MSESRSRRRALLALARPEARRWCTLGVLVAATSASAVAAPLVVRRIVDEITTSTTVANVRQLALLFLVIVVVGQLLSVWVVATAMRTAWDTTNDLRIRITQHVLGLDHEFHRNHTPGELISRVDGDVTAVSDFLGTVVPKALGAFFLVTGIAAVLTVVDWRIGLGITAYFVLALRAVSITRHRSVREAADEMGANARLYGGLEERINASEDLRSNGAGAYAMWRFVQDSRAVMHAAVRRERAYLGMWWAAQGSIVVGTVLSIVVSAIMVSRGSMSVGTAFLVFQYVLLIGQPLEEFVHELETVQKATGAMVRVVDLLAVDRTVRDDGTTSPPDGPLAIDFRGVGFEYGDDRAVLHQIDLHVGAGRTVGVVGRTGSGKTTFSRLVLRLVESTEGIVELGGVAVADVPMSELRRRVALVPQEVELFGGTVRDNVTLFDPHPTDLAVEAALRAVGLDALVEGGIDRDLGAGGGGLSAGEAQLMAMARVWLRDPDLVVLDEATARVDPETEQRLDEAVRRLVAGRTTLIIAHRLSTLRAVDDVVVFERGRIVEHGTRAALASDPTSRFHRLLAAADGDPGHGFGRQLDRVDGVDA